MNASAPHPAGARQPWLPLSALAQDLRFVLRSLGKSPGYTLAVIVTLALGIGAATAIFSAADRALFRPPPYPDSDQLVAVGIKTQRQDFLWFHLPVQFAAYRQHATLISSWAAMESTTVNLVVDGEPKGISVGRVSLDYFGTLGVVPLLGRSFVPGEDQTGAEHVLILTHRFWRQRFNGDPSVLGRDVILDGKQCRIIGVLPENFAPPGYHAALVYQPLVLNADPAQPYGRYLTIVGRLRAGVAAEQARAELLATPLPVTGRWAKSIAENGVRVLPLAQTERSFSLNTMHWALLGAVGFLYAIACTNALSLMLARLHGRRRELCVRLAIGCSRARLARLIAAENLTVTLLAGLGGVFVAQWLFPALVRLGLGDRSGMSTGSFDGRMFGFTGALIVLTALLVSMPAVWQISGAEPTEGLKEGAGAFGESRRLRRFRGIIIVLESSLAVVLLVGAGLMVRSVQRLQEVDRGFDPSNKAAVWLELPRGAYAAPDAQRTFCERLEQQLRTVPGVEGIAITSAVPMAGKAGGYVKNPAGTELFVGTNPVSLGYLRMLGLPLLRGQWFDDAVMGGTRVVVLNDTMARAWFGTEDPIGRVLPAPFRRDAEPWLVVGIVADVREQVRTEPAAQIYFPYWQSESNRGLSVLLRLNKPMDSALSDAVCRAVFAVEPLAATTQIRPLSEAAAGQIAMERHVLAVLRVLSTLALALSTAGLFAVMAYAVAQRMGEFGVRLALGAVPADLLRLVLRRGLLLASIGVVIGCGAAWGLTRFLQSLLYETSPVDPLVYAAVALLLLTAAALGCWLPARRAARADVANLLRAE